MALNSSVSKGRAPRRREGEGDEGDKGDDDCEGNEGNDVVDDVMRRDWEFVIPPKSTHVADDMMIVDDVVVEC